MSINNDKSSYRPHDAGHDYYAPGIYLITLVVRHREHNATMFGHLGDDLRAPAVVLNGVGEAVMGCWNSIPEYQARYGRRVKLHAAVCMPDHFHGVIEVLERMDVSVGQVICGFKIGCTQAWRRMQQPCTAAGGDGWQEPYMASASAQALPDIHHMSKRQRADYYALHPEAQQPLWDDNYDDTICLSDPLTGGYSQRHLSAMIRYVEDNARRAIVRRQRPQFMQRCLHVEMQMTTQDGQHVVRTYAAFGNLFLLRWARKVQVFCHRKAPDGRTPYETTDEYRQRCREWKRMVMEGATVIVTPGISKGELNIKNRCLESGYPLIHLQKEPIGRYWKPEQRRFDLCCLGRLLILAPWKPEELGDVTHVPSASDFAIFHNLNMLAEEICRFDGEATILQF